MEEMPKGSSSVKPQLADAMEETPKEVSREESSEPTQTRWWEPTQMVKVNEKSDSGDESIASQELSVIVQQGPGGSGKKTKQMKIEDCSTGFKAVAERLSATQEKKKRRKKRNKKSKEYIFHHPLRTVLLYSHATVVTYR